MNNMIIKEHFFLIYVDFFGLLYFRNETQLGYEYKIHPIEHVVQFFIIYYDMTVVLYCMEILNYGIEEGFIFHKLFVLLIFFSNN